MIKIGVSCNNGKGKRLAGANENVAPGLFASAQGVQDYAGEDG